MNRDASNSNKTCDKTVFLDLAADLCHKGTASRDSYSNTGISTQDRCTATVPRLEFEQAVRQHHADRHLRGFPCEGQFVAMLFCQLGQAHSLREICGGLAATEGKLKQLGLSAAPKRCTLSYANGQRPWQLFETVFPQRLGKCRGQLGLAAGGHKLRFKNRLLSLDARVIDLGVSRFDWAQLQRTQGAIQAAPAAGPGRLFALVGRGHDGQSA